MYTQFNFDYNLQILIVIFLNYVPSNRHRKVYICLLIYYYNFLTVLAIENTLTRREAGVDVGDSSIPDHEIKIENSSGSESSESSGSSESSESSESEQ